MKKNRHGEYDKEMYEAFRSMVVYILGTEVGNDDEIVDGYTPTFCDIHLKFAAKANKGSYRKLIRNLRIKN